MSATETPTDTGTVTVAHDGPVAIVTMSYPERRNALSLKLRAVMLDRLRDLLADETCRVIVVTGEGAHFCSGGDISSFQGVTAPAGRLRMQRIQPIIRILTAGDKPTIAAVEGFAAGAGACVAAACDVVVASREAKFSCTFNKIGLFPDLGGAWSLPARMGLGRAKMLMMAGRVLNAETAERQGLVDQIAEPGQALKDAIALGREISATAPLSNALIKAVLARGPASLDETLAAEADAQGIAYGSQDFEEGRDAFMGKRTPVFKGR